MPAPVSSEQSGSARERILDAAAQVMRERGLAKSTTKEIARAAGYSEALLYKHFADKHEIYMGVLRERVRGYVSPIELIGSGTIEGNLVQVTTQLMAFYVQTFPMSASIFSTPELLTTWRDGMTVKGTGPRAPLRNLERYLEGERELGRLSANADPTAIATALCGAAFQSAFLACFYAETEVPDGEALARRTVASLRL
jgi:AcrR family transcriptional regulator